MPDSENNPLENAAILKQSLGLFLDMIVQSIAVLFALVDSGILTFPQVQAHVDRLSQVPSVLKARSAYGPRSEALDELLKAYEGPIQ